jgi:anaerobic selenocysteine-containing dehydrogenase
VSRSPKAPIIAGLVPCNVIAEEILTDHPDRYRAMIVESANPAHSLADSRRMREALRALDCVVVIDVAMTETARLADYVLPTPSQYEKWEATFFNFEFPANYFHLRRPVLDPPPGSDLLPEPEIHARLCEALGAVTEAELAPLREAAALGRAAFATAFVMAHHRQSEAARAGAGPPVPARSVPHCPMAPRPPPCSGAPPSDWPSGIPTPSAVPGSTRPITSWATRSSPESSRADPA